MSSGFVSGGSLEAPVERDEQWKQAQAELDAERARKAKIEAERGGKSLYEVLQANKAAKEEQVQQSLKLSNQFLSLDEDDISFLDSVLETERAKEQEVRKQTAESLDAFKRQQEEEERQAKLRENLPVAVDESPDWFVASKKRKKSEKEGFRGVKLRKTSSSGGNAVGQAIEGNETVESDLKDERPVGHDVKANIVKANDAQSKPAQKTGGLGLVAYSDSDSNSEE